MKEPNRKEFCNVKEAKDQEGGCHRWNRCRRRRDRPARQASQEVQEVVQQSLDPEHGI